MDRSGTWTREYDKEGRLHRNALSGLILAMIEHVSSLPNKIGVDHSEIEYI